MSGYGGHREISLRVPVPPTVRRLMILLTGIYVLSALAFELLPLDTVVRIFGNLFLVHGQVFGEGKVWTIVTYAWFHEIRQHPLLSIAVCVGALYFLVWLYRQPFARREFFLFLIAAMLIMTLVGNSRFGAPMHLAGNLLVLYFFGHVFEDRWGPRRFWFFWFLCTIAGGLLSTLAWLVMPGLAGEGPVVGASAGVIGLIAAYSVTFPEQQVLYGLVVPIKGKYFLLIALAFDLVSLVGGSPIAFFAHLGGALAAVLLCTGYWRPGKVMARFGGPPRRKNHLRVVRGDRDDPPPPPRYLH